MKAGVLSQTVLALTAMAGACVCFAQDSNPPPVQPVQTGTAPFLFQTVPGWGATPDNLTLGPTHGGIAVDKSGNVYVANDGPGGIFVFDRAGQFLRAMAPNFSGTHSLVIRNENGTEYLYGVHLRRTRAFKMTLAGNPIFFITYPKAANLYGSKGEGFKPTSIAVAPDGSIFVADGYGTNYIHKYNSQGQYLGSFGGTGSTNGKFKGCLSMVIDARSETPVLLVADCNNGRLQTFDLDGQFLGIVVTGLAKPSSLSIFGQYLAVAEHDGRVSILDQGNAPVATLGQNDTPEEWGSFSLAKSSWREGVFFAPHSLAWDPGSGALYVEDWSVSGRVTKLSPVQ